MNQSTFSIKQNSTSKSLPHDSIQSCNHAIQHTPSKCNKLFLSAFPLCWCYFFDFFYNFPIQYFFFVVFIRNKLEIITCRKQKKDFFFFARPSEAWSRNYSQNYVHFFILSTFALPKKYCEKSIIIFACTAFWYSLVVRKIIF